MMVLCPTGADTPMYYTTGGGAALDKMTVCPSAPIDECRKFLADGSRNAGVRR